MERSLDYNFGKIKVTVFSIMSLSFERLLGGDGNFS